MKKYEELEKLVSKENIKYNESMKKYTTMKVGGNVECLVTPTSIKEITQVVKFARENNIKLYVLGNGSNVIVKDEGILGIVLKLSNKFADVKIDGEYITALSGATMPYVSMLAKKNMLSGLEFACGIPGTIGGGAKMNAGAYGSEMSNVIEEVTYIDEDLNIKTIKNKECNFSYRHSIFTQNKDFVIVEVKMKLEKGNLKDVEEKMEEYRKARTEKQPLEYPNSGSIFKRPEGYFVGKLVQDAGLRGKTIGGAQVSTKHTGFIVNIGNATCKDVEDLIKFVQDTVYEKFGVKLETEVEFIGGK